MPAADPPPPSRENRVHDSNDIYDADALARELMMPTGEPVAAVIGACLLLGMIWFASGHAVGSHLAHPAAPRASLQSDGGAVRPPGVDRSAG